MFRQDASIPDGQPVTMKGWLFQPVSVTDGEASVLGVRLMAFKLLAMISGQSPSPTLGKDTSPLTSLKSFETALRLSLFEAKAS